MTEIVQAVVLTCDNVGGSGGGRARVGAGAAHRRCSVCGRSEPEIGAQTAGIVFGAAGGVCEPCARKAVFIFAERRGERDFVADLKRRNSLPPKNMRWWR